ncbi:hypothetical protein E4U55_001053 [Claviceps digitariae]|nr:hypothetical protein E4U55_001053 [Claviceps digitariae]
MTTRQLTVDELNKAALEQFVYQPVSREMISFLAEAAHNVITCDSALMPPNPSSHQSRQQQSSDNNNNKTNPPTPPRSPKSEDLEIEAADNTLPSLEEFITQLVVSSNVQVPTLMSTLVYLTRLKSKLQPMARGLRCTTHRIFLAALILSAKYLNDSSPKNKHWANYTHITTDLYTFGFNRTEVNLMEKQLLFLLEWDLRIKEQDLYRELDSFLAPLRTRAAEKQARKMRHREEKKRQQEAASARYYSPPASRGPSRSRHHSPETLRSVNGAGSVSPPGLTYSSSGSSYASSIASSRQQSRSTTPLDSNPSPYIRGASQAQASLYNSPIDVVLDADLAKPVPEHSVSKDRMLPYSISIERCHELQEESPKKRHKRGMWERLLGGAVAVR